MIDVPAHVQMILGYDRLFRSQVIYEAIDLESVLDRIIAWHFCPDEARHGAFFSLVFQEGEISFAKKSKMLDELLRHSYPDLKEAFGFLPKRLDAVRELRNKFAHSQVVLPDKPPPPNAAGGVTLRRLKKGNWVEEFISRAHVDARVSECRDLMVATLLLEMLIVDRVTNKVEAKEESAILALAKAVRDKLARQAQPG